MRPTTAWEKLLTSIINTFATVLLAMLCFVLLNSFDNWKLVIVGSFFVLLFVSYLFNENRNLGMMIVGSYWNKKATRQRRMLYNILYTLSFSTMFFYIFFPLDLFLINILIVQFTCVRLTGTTLHGYVAGGFVSMKQAG